MSPFYGHYKLFFKIHKNVDPCANLTSMTSLFLVHITSSYYKFGFFFNGLWNAFLHK